MNEHTSRDGKKHRIVLTTFGSLGDLHPYVAVALGLKERGHEAVIATGKGYQSKVEALGLNFCPIRPDHAEVMNSPELMAYYMDLRKGPERIVREMFMNVLTESYEDTLAAAAGADLLVSHPLTFTTQLVAEKLSIPWVSSILSPSSFFSVYDPPVLAPAPFLSKLRFLGPLLYKPLFGFLKGTVHSWADPWHRLRADLGLPPQPGNPLFEIACSPVLHLALCSSLLAPRQPDWPAQTVVTGFPCYDQHEGTGMPAELVEFLAAGAAADRFHTRLRGGDGCGPVLRTECHCRQDAGTKGRPPGWEGSTQSGQFASRWRGGLRLCSLLGTLPESGGHRPPGRHRHDRAGSAFGSAHDCGALCA